MLQSARESSSDSPFAFSRNIAQKIPANPILFVMGFGKLPASYGATDPPVLSTDAWNSSRRMAV
jgi:hypothetical protein